MASTGKLDGRERVFEINVTNEFRFRASTSNSIQTEWVNVTYVQPPAVVDLQVVATAPTYTGLEPSTLTGGGPYAVLEGSRISVSASYNKPLRSAELIAAGETIPIGVTDDVSVPLAFSVPADSANGDAAQPLAGGEYELKLVDESGLANIRRSRFSITIKEDMPPKLRADLLGISGLVTLSLIHI